MDLTFSPEEEAFRAEVRAFIAENLPASVKGKARRDFTTREEFLAWHRIFYKQGWVAPLWPKEYGGTGWTVTQRYIFNEECARAETPLTLPFGVAMVGPVIYTFASEQQKKKYLPRILSGDDWWCQGYSEPGAGSDLAGLKTRAVREGDHYIVNGQKTWTTLAQYADWIFCLVRTDTSVKSQEGITFLLIDMKTPGITVKPIIVLDGAHEVNEVFFDNVKVPVENRVGDENKGWTYAKFLLVHERSGIAGVARSKKAVERLREVARAETIEGVPLVETDDFSRKIAELEIDLSALEYTELRTLAQEARGGHAGPESSILKIKGTEIQQRITELTVEAIGYYGYPFERGFGDNEYPVGPDYAVGQAGLYFNMRKASIYGGSNEIQRNIIAKAVLGLSRTRTNDKRHSGTTLMDFSFTEEQTLLRNSISKFLAGHYGSKTFKKISRTEPGWNRDYWRQFAELGLLGASLPEEHGGLGGGPVETMIVMEEFGRALVVEPYVATVVVGGGFFVHGGSDAQKQEWLPKIAGGETVIAFAFAEPQGRYNFADLTTTAKKQGSAYVLNGHKAVVLGAPWADTLIVTARTSGGQRDDKGVSVFLVDKKSKGITTRDYPTVDGLRASEVTFENVEVPGANVIGAIDDGLKLVEQVTDAAIAAHAAEAVGAMKVLLDATVEYSKTRKQFGVPIGKFQVLQHRMVDMFMNTEQSASITYMVTLKLDEGEVERKKAASAAKVQIGKAGQFVGQNAVQLHGGMGMTDELNVGHYFKRLTMLDALYGNVDHHLKRYASLG